MAKVTEQDIIDHLEEKIKFHQKEARRLENLLSAFVSDSSTPRTRKAKLEAVDEAIDPLPAKEIKSAGHKPASTEPSAIGNSVAPPLEIPAKYTDNLPAEAKIAFALNELGGSGSAADIANAMAQYEPKSDSKKIGRQIAGVLTSLKEQGSIKAEKSGRKELYSLLS